MVSLDASHYDSRKNSKAAKKCPENSRETYPPTQLHFLPFAPLQFSIVLCEHFRCRLSLFFPTLRHTLSCCILSLFIAFLFLCLLFRLAHTPHALCFGFHIGRDFLAFYCLPVCFSVNVLNRAEGKGEKKKIFGCRDEALR